MACPMALCRPAIRLSPSLLPPGLLRLGLEPARVEAVVQTARCDGPAAALSWLVQRGVLRADPTQRRAADQLDDAWASMRSFEAELPGWRAQNKAWESECARLRAEHEERLRRRAEQAEPSRKRGAQAGATAAASEEKTSGEPKLWLPTPPPKPSMSTRGCYLWGDVGRGKTLLMDLFAAASQHDGNAERRVLRIHFHEFMHSLHQRMQQRRAHSKQIESSRKSIQPILAEMIAGTPPVLCLDEFQITSIADAALVTHVFKELMSLDALVVTTSNREPHMLYENGLNRHSFIPAFVSYLQENVRVHHLDAPLDYREIIASESAAAHVANNSEEVESQDFMLAADESSTDALAMQFMAATKGSLGEARALPIAWGRKLQCRSTAEGVASFSFDELCCQPLSADDYAALVSQAGMHTFVVSDVPKFSLSLHNEARRFTNLVDCLYDHQCRLVCEAAAPVEELFEGVEVLSGVKVADKPKPLDASSDVPTLRRHGDVNFKVGTTSPCRPDTFATAEADSEAGTTALGLECLGLEGASEHGEGGGIQGVMPEAAESLREAGFAARRCASRLREMGTPLYRGAHEARWHA